MNLISHIVTTLNHRYIHTFLLLCISLFMLGANPFKSQTIAPMDLLTKYPGWQNTGLHLPYINGERSDVLDAKLPIWVSAKHTLWQGELPLWNHQRAGTPGLTFTNSLFTPAFATFALVKNDALGFYLSNLINVLIGLWGMFFFLRLFFHPFAALFGAFVFMFSGFNAAWFFWAHIDTAIWSPWVLYTVYQYISTKEKKHLIPMTLSMLFLNLGGFPMIAVMTYLTTAIMVITFFIAKKYPFRQWISLLSILIIFGLLAVLIALPSIYPLVELFDWMQGMGYRSCGAGFSTHDFALFYNPDLYKIPRVETTFYVGVLPLLFLAIAPIYSLIRPTFIAIFALLSFLLALSISFALIDIDILRQIPAINSSLLTRFGYMMDMALAILSAFGIHFLITTFSKLKPIILIITIGTLFFIQIYQQKSLFRDFNGPVPNSSFYPSTTTLTYLQKTLTPLQHVMADSGYLIAGTLGGYGLNDWFAHSFHKGREKEILRKIVHRPFKTPTSAMFNFSQINLKSPYIDYMGIKSILSTHYSDMTPIPFWQDNPKQQPCPTLPNNTLEQPFVLKKNYTVDAIQLKMATYGAAHADSDIRLILKDNQGMVTSLIASKDSIHDNSWVTFAFTQKQTLKAGEYTLSIAFVDNNARAVTVWSNQNEAHYKLHVNGKAVPLSFKMRFANKSTLHPKYQLRTLEPNIYLLDNTHISSNAYYLSQLKETVPADYTMVETLSFENTRIHLHYKGNTAGWVVLPMRKYPGWQATVDGTPSQIESFLGVLPAVKVNPKSDIILTYKPKYANVTYLVSLVSLLILIFLTYRFRTRD